MKVIKLEDLDIVYKADTFFARKVLEHDHIKVMNIIIEEGGTVPAHSVPVDVLFYIIEGKGSIQIGKERRTVQGRDIIPCPPDTDMSLFADQGQKMIVLNIKTPAYNPV